MKIFLEILVLLLMGTGSLRGEEITTNASGGGPWSDPATWRGNIVPGPLDDVVLRNGDTVAFDRDDDGKVTCQKLLLDPGAMLTFKTEAGKIVCCPADVIEAHGPIKLDGAKSADDRLELRLVGKDSKARVIKLLKKGGLFIAGKADLPMNLRNVRLSGDEEVRLELGQAASLDVQHAVVENLRIHADTVDNTGTLANERLNFIDNRCQGGVRLSFLKCDTPIVRGNHFQGGAEKNQAAIHLRECPLGEIRGNHISGFTRGIQVANSADTLLLENRIEKCATGIDVESGSAPVLKANHILHCETGIHLKSVHLAGVSDNLIDETKIALAFQFGSAQVNSLRVKNLAKDGAVVQYSYNGELTLVNCDLGPSQVKYKERAKADKFTPSWRVSAWQYLSVDAPDAPAGSLIAVRTAHVKDDPDRADANVRNSPASLIGGLTPLPRQPGAMLVKTWAVDDKDMLVPAPSYEIKIFGPVTGVNEQPLMLKSTIVQPDESWSRLELKDVKPTVQVRVK